MWRSIYSLCVDAFSVNRREKTTKTLDSALCSLSISCFTCVRYGLSIFCVVQPDCSTRSFETNPLPKKGTVESTDLNDSPVLYQFLLSY